MLNVFRSFLRKILLGTPFLYLSAFLFFLAFLLADAVCYFGSSFPGSELPLDETVSQLIRPEILNGLLCSVCCITVIFCCLILFEVRWYSTPRREYIALYMLITVFALVLGLCCSNIISNPVSAFFENVFQTALADLPSEQNFDVVEKSDAEKSDAEKSDVEKSDAEKSEAEKVISSGQRRLKAVQDYSQELSVFLSWGFLTFLFLFLEFFLFFDMNGSFRTRCIFLLTAITTLLWFIFEWNRLLDEKIFIIENIPGQAACLVLCQMTAFWTVLAFLSHVQDQVSIFVLGHNGRRYSHSLYINADGRCPNCGRLVFPRRRMGYSQPPPRGVDAENELENDIYYQRSGNFQNRFWGRNHFRPGFDDEDQNDQFPPEI